MESEAQLVVASVHPAIPGHFPGNPVVPGVLLLAHVQAALAARLVPGRGPLRLTAVPHAKFLAPLAPDEPCAIAFPRISEEGGRSTAHFECRASGRIIACGVLHFELDERGRD